MNPRFHSTLQWLGAFLRLAIGVLFIYMGLGKALDPVAFLKLARQYNLPFDYWLLNAIAAGLPWFEGFCGCLLATGVAVRGTALVCVLMLVPFTVTVALRAADIAHVHSLAFCAVKFDCGCGAGEVWICAKIAENALLTAVSLFLLAGHGRPLALLFEASSQNKAKNGSGTAPGRQAEH